MCHLSISGASTSVKTKNSSHITNPLIRSKAMTSSKFVLVAAIVAVLLINFTALAQAPAAGDMIITNASTFSGAGVIKIKGSIIDTAYAKTITGKTSFIGGAHQAIGRNQNTTYTLSFDSLEAANSGAFVDTMRIPVKVNANLAITSGTLLVNGSPLEVDGITTHAGGTLNASGPSDSVAYNEAGATTQPIIDATYNKLAILNTAPKNLLNPVVASQVFHTGAGGLTVNKKFTVNTSGTFTTISDASDSLVINGAASNTIATVATTSAGGVIQNYSSSALGITTVTAGSGTIATATAPLNIATLTTQTGTIQTTTGALTIATMNGNAGTIKTNGAGTVAFTNAAVNGGTIAGNTGSVTFNNTLTNTAGSVTAGAGDIIFKDIVSIPGGSVTSASAGDSLIFQKPVRVYGGALSLTGTGTAALYDSLQKSSGSLNFASGSTTYFEGGAQMLASANYGNLVLGGSGDKVTGASNDSVQSNLKLTHNLTVNSGNYLLMSSNTGANITDSGEVIGTVRRTGTWAANTLYDFNRIDVALAALTGGAEDMSLTMTPAHVPSGTLPTTKYVNRQYQYTHNGGGIDNLSQFKLYYATGELVGSPDVTKFGVRDYNGTAWTKIAAAGYTHTVTPLSGGGDVLISGAPIAYAGVQELGIFQSGLVTVQAGSYALGTTWDEGRYPDLTDDAEVKHAVTLGAGESGNAGTLLIDQTGGSITFGAVNAALNVATSLTNNGTIQINTGTLQLNNTATFFDNSGTLNLSTSTSSIVNVYGGYFKQNGTLSNGGVINLGQ